MSTLFRTGQRDESSQQTFRLDAASYAFIGRCNGASTSEQIWEAISTELGEHTPTQDAILRLIIRLQSAGFLHFDKSTDITSLFPTRREELMLKGKKLNPFAFTLNLGNPTTILRALSPLERIFFQPLSLIIWGGIFLVGLLIAIIHLNELSAHARHLLNQPNQLWLMWIIYPIVKFIHEINHGLAVRRWGGNVREWGISIMMLMPIPFVNASAAHNFTRYRRATVSAAGIMAELMIAVIALMVWLNVQPGLMRDIAFQTMMICAISTVVVNGNPLLRFDGYFLFTDLMDLPNLSTRSSIWWRQHLKYWFQGLPAVEEIYPARGETPWLIVYQPLSWLYRVVLITGILLWFGTLLPILALTAGLWFGWLLFLKPLHQVLQSLFDKNLTDHLRLRSRSLAAILTSFLIIGFFFVPVNNVTLTQGITWLSDTAVVRNESAGFIVDVYKLEGDKVELNDLILRLEDPELVSQAQRLNIERDALRNRLFQHMNSDSSETAQVARRIAHLEREIEHLNTRIVNHEVRANSSGILHLPHASDLLGRYLHKGEEIGVILEDSPILIRSILPHYASQQLSDVRHISVRLAEVPDTSFRGILTGRISAARNQLPSSALGQPVGGPIPVEPFDPEGITTSIPIIWMDILLPNTSQVFAGGRAYIRLEYPPKPIAQQLWYHTRQLFLGRFDEVGI